MAKTTLVGGVTMVVDRKITKKCGCSMARSRSDLKFSTRMASLILRFERVASLPPTAALACCQTGVFEPCLAPVTQGHARNWCPWPLCMFICTMVGCSAHGMAHTSLIWNFGRGVIRENRICQPIGCLPMVRRVILLSDRCDSITIHP